LPALGIGIVHRGEIVGLGMAGVRVAGTADVATLEDSFAVASCAKSVTGTIAAMLVAQGRVRWDTTVAEAFPELRGLIHQGYAGTTLERLLRHRGGLDHEMNHNLRWAGWNRTYATESPTGQRMQFVKAALQRPPRYAPGTEAYYTSDGYIVAGSMLERAAGVDFEQLARTLLFEPLGLRSMRYGLVSADGVLTRVAGHEPGWFGWSRSIAPDPSRYGLHPFGAPAGFLHASLPDLLRYVDFHIQGANGRSGLLPRAAFEWLHRAVDDQRYALGWESEVRRDPRGHVLEHSVFHGGYSGEERANIWFSPETQWGTVIVTNHGRGDEAVTADIFFALLREFQLLPAAPPAP
jgi:CubicO group peptidase (beta-lactamase class C family)